MSDADWLIGMAACGDTARMSDDDREALILQLSERRDALFFANKRDQARLVQEHIAALIAQRSGAYVRHMEQKKGLSVPFCARKPSGRQEGGSDA